MNESEQIEMMKRCSDEIKTLRAEIDRLRPRAEAYDNMAEIIRLIPRPSQGYGEDIAWMLDKKVAEIIERQDQRKTPIGAPR